MNKPSLHSQITNLTCVVKAESLSPGTRNWQEGYIDGFTRARHAAAELANEADATIKELLAACKSAECSCSLRERDSGHRVGCWMPDMKDAIANAESNAPTCPLCGSPECKTIIVTDHGTGGARRDAGCLLRQMERENP